MLSIGQFSRTCLTSVKALRHYDKIGLIHPVYTDPVTGYRYYEENQIPQMLLITRLKRYGFQLAEIKEFLTKQDPGALLLKFQEQKKKLQLQMTEASFIMGELEAHLLDFERTGDIMTYQNQYIIATEQTAEIPVLSCRQKMSMEEFGKYYGILYEKVAKEQIALDGKVMAIYHDESFDPDWNDTELALGVQNTAQATRMLAGGLCAVTMHYGSYSSLSDAYGALVKWIGENGYQIASAPYEIYLKTQFDQLPPEKWETKIFFPIQKKA